MALVQQPSQHPVQQLQLARGVHQMSERLLCIREPAGKHICAPLVAMTGTHTYVYLRGRWCQTHVEHTHVYPRTHTHARLHSHSIAIMHIHDNSCSWAITQTFAAHAHVPSCKNTTNSFSHAIMKVHGHHIRVHTKAFLSNTSMACHHTRKHHQRHARPAARKTSHAQTTAQTCTSCYTAVCI